MSNAAPDILNDQTLEFGRARPRLNASLRFYPRTIAGRTGWLVEDELTGRYYRIGMPQYVFLTLLNGQRTVSSALMHSATLLREDALDESEAAALCQWALEARLLDPEHGDSQQRRVNQQQAQQSRQLMSWINPIMLRIPLGSPDRPIAALSRYLGFLTGPLGIVVWFLVVAFGFAQLAGHWRRFYSEQIVSIAADDLVWISATWLVLKLCHELAHGLVCHRFGGRIHSCGVLLLLFIPMPYVDVTSAWRFPQRRQRMLTAAAGMAAEISLAAIACLIWVNSPPGPTQYHAGIFFLSATMYTLLFNMNPLMKFDGYYLLTDLLDLPNLYTRSRRWLMSRVRRFFFGITSPTVDEVGYRAVFLRVYGVLSLLWSLLILSGLLLAAWALIPGIGLIIAVLSAILWLTVPVVRFLIQFFADPELTFSNRLRFCSLVACLTLVTVGFLKWCPAPSVVSAPCVLDYEPLAVVRAQASGFVRTIYVSDGQHVEAGDRLVTLENPQLKQELRSLRVEIRASKLRLNSLLSSGRVTHVQLEQETLRDKLQRQDELEQHLAHLEVVAPQHGRVLSRNVECLVGTYQQPGDELFQIGTPDKIHAISLVSQSDSKWLRENKNVPVELFVEGRHQYEFLRGSIHRIEPRARADIPHDAFSATNGGPLSVVMDQPAVPEEKHILRLTQPRVPVELQLESSQDSLLAGQRGRLFVRSRETTMGQFLHRRFVRTACQALTSRMHGL